jgi:hypothetical protein
MFVVGVGCFVYRKTSNPARKDSCSQCSGSARSNVRVSTLRSPLDSEHLSPSFPSHAWFPFIPLSRHLGLTADEENQMA